MIVVADTGPLYYLALIGQADVLGLLYTHVLVPTAVAQEMRQDATPAVIRSWISQPPDWIEIRTDPSPDPALSWLDAGESAAISLALALGVERILIDDWDGRVEAVRRHLRVTGTLGVLVLAHRRGLLDFETALARLSQTNFYLSAELVRLVRRRLAGGIEEP
jgi:predicted nucleic acid-binding protein